MSTHIATLTYIDIYHIKDNLYAYKPHYSALKSTFMADSFDDAITLSSEFNKYIENSCRVMLNAPRFNE